MHRGLQFVAAVAALSLSACAGANIDTVWDTQYDFAELGTFDWVVKPPENGTDIQSALDSAIKTTVERHMTASGIRRSSDDPSFMVTYYVGVDEIVGLDAGYYGSGWGGHWGWGWYGPTGLNVSQYDSATITIDILSSDPAVGLIWRGIARTELLPSGQNTGSVDAAIRKVLEDFPPEEEENNR